jgi:hypothetical protein
MMEYPAAMAMRDALWVTLQLAGPPWGPRSRSALSYRCCRR